MSLTFCPSPDSLLCRRINADPSTRDTVRKAYEFALAHVGQDKDSYEIWNEYIQFLKSGEVNESCVVCVNRFFLTQLFEKDKHNLGRAAKDGRRSESLPAGSSDPNGERQEIVGRLPRFRKQPQQDHCEFNMLCASTSSYVNMECDAGQEVYL